MSDGANTSWRGIGGLGLGLLAILSSLPLREAVAHGPASVERNDPPMVSMRYREEEVLSGDSLQLAALQRLSLDLTGFDPDGDPISFSPIQLPDGATWTASTLPGQAGGVIAWRPTQSQVGVHPLRVDYVAGSDNGSLLLSLHVLAPAAMVTCSAFAPQGTVTGETLTLMVDAPTAPGAALILILGPEMSPPMQLPPTLFGGTSALAIDPTAMTVLFNGVSLSGPPAFSVPFTFSTPIPPGLDGWTLSLQAFVQDQSLFFSSPLTHLSFGDPTPLGV